MSVTDGGPTADDYAADLARRKRTTNELGPSALVLGLCAACGGTGYHLDSAGDDVNCDACGGSGDAS